jgi:hypothetical protein
MMALDQNFPIFPIATLSAYYPLAAVLYFDVTSAPAESIGTRWRETKGTFTP